MFELLTNLLVWVVSIPIFYFLFQRVPKEWFRIVGLTILSIVTVIFLARLPFIDTPVPQLITYFLAFPFSLLGISFFFILNWRRIYDLKVRGGESKFVGEKFDNDKVKDAIKSVKYSFLIVILILVIGSNNGVACGLTGYFDRQAQNAVEQGKRRPYPNLDATELAALQDDVFDGLVIPYEDVDDSPSDRLQYAYTFWRDTPPDRPLPFIIITAGQPLNEVGFPCDLEVTEEQKNDPNLASMLRGTLRYDSRFEDVFLKPEPPKPEPKERTAADLFCRDLVRLEPQLRSSIMLLPEFSSLFRYGENVRRQLTRLSDDKVRFLTPRREPLPFRLLLLTPTLSTSRGFLSFRNHNLDVEPRPIDTQRLFCRDRRFPKPRSFIFSSQAFAQTEAVWNEIRELLLYTLRFWIQPPLTDERPYQPTSSFELGIQKRNPV